MQKKDCSQGEGSLGAERKIVKKVRTEMENELRPEYDLKCLQVRKIGPRRKSLEVDSSR